MIHVVKPDYGHAYALLFDDHHSEEHPIGFIGASMSMDADESAPLTSEIAGLAAKWIAEGIEWEAARRAVVYYWLEGEPEVEMVLAASPSETRVTTFKVVEE